MRTSREMLNGFEEFVRSVTQSSFWGTEEGKDLIRDYLAGEFSTADRVIVLGLAFTRWTGKVLRALVRALNIPREQRMFIGKAAERIRATSEEKDKLELLRLVSSMGQRYPDLKPFICSTIPAENERVAVEA